MTPLVANISPEIIQKGNPQTKKLLLHLCPQNRYVEIKNLTQSLIQCTPNSVIHIAPNNGKIVQ